ncbi:MAG: hypothetical protein AB8B83_00580 [Bdellovibrionales bacterium]
MNTADGQQPQYTGGMKYTTMRKAQPNDAEKNVIYNRKKESPVDQAEPQANSTPETDNKKPAEQSVWEKYKELAAGKASQDDENSEAPDAPQKPDAPNKPVKQTKSASQKKTGIGSIIHDYKRNKEKRGQMKSISFEKPEAIKTPKIDKPTIETPEEN